MRTRVRPSSATHARLRVRRRAVPLHTFLPLLRGLAVLSLLAALLIGGLRFVLFPLDATALDFTLHQIGADRNAVNVLGITTHDVDDDGDVDIITAGGDGLKLYENQGEFTFRTHIIDTVSGERAQVADLNQDGSPDILVTIRSGAPLKWYRNNGNLDFSPNTLMSSGKDVVAYARDLDNDRDRDIVTSHRESEFRILTRWMNDGAGGFTQTVMHTDSGVTAIGAADIDNNSYADIVTGGSQGLQRWKTTDGVSWERIDIDDSKQNRSHLAIADPGDGRVFIVTGDATDNVVAIYRTRNSAEPGRLQLGGDATDARTVAPADFDGDGDLDVVVAAQDDNQVVWYTNDGAEHFTKRTLVSNVQSVYGVAVADLDGDDDLDYVTSDHFRGPVSVYERIRAKPQVTAAKNIQQSTGGTGIVTFEAVFSDPDFDPTRARIQYSLDGQRWDKPWLTKVTTDVGSVDLKNSNGYQVGTSNSFDTDDNDNVTATFTWDTKSSQNTGGPIVGEGKNVQLRIIPRDNRNIGTPVKSSAFVVDNGGPQNVKDVQITEINESEATLSWPLPIDSSAFTFEVFYGTDSQAVLDQTSDSWDTTKDENLADVESTTTTITGLEANKTYTFKLVVTDEFGNSTGAPSVRGTTTTTPAADDTADTPNETTPEDDTPDTPLVEDEPDTPDTTDTTPDTPPDIIPPTEPEEDKPPSVLENNQAPVADAGPDQLVNPTAIVVLDSTSSVDQDGDSLVHRWRQIHGPKVDLLSERTVNPTFNAGEENETYIFSLTVRDTNGATATDQVTVATKSLIDDTQVDVEVGPSPLPTDLPPEEVPVSPLVSTLLHPADMVLFTLSVLSTLLLIIERLLHTVRQRGGGGDEAAVAAPLDRGQQGRVVHYKTGQPVANAQILIYGQDGKLRATERTNPQGVFATFFPVGEYTLGVQAEGFTVASTAPRALAPEGGLIYTGGKLTVRNANTPLPIVIPLKPVGAEVSSSRVRILHIWQLLQHLGRVLSWPIFLSGALLNTVLVFMAARPLYLVIEVIYILLVIIKIALEVRIRPAYGQVRDAITHVPLDLAVVRLFEERNNRLVMTRVTNNQGKFFALPPAGTYTVTISKPGYATFTKPGVKLKSEHDTTLQLTADLMPVAPPTGGLAQARAAVL